ncbi:MAG: hypothetical protein JOY57_16415 [Actinobacteria bacterium]|nr:hypothetical protein [Actinomycetota bacterium]
MRRLLFAVGTLGALLVLAAHPAGAVQAGQSCSNADAQAGTVITADNGSTVKCVASSAGVNQWTAIVAATNTTVPRAATTTTTVAAASAVTATPPTMATTGLNHTRQFVLSAIVLLCLGTAIVLEIRARQGLDRLHVQRLIAQLPGATRRSTRNDPH